MLVPVALISLILWLFGDRIYQWDLSMVYGGVLKKLETLIAEMEELRAEQVR